jgi:putative glutathione S-transferase
LTARVRRLICKENPHAAMSQFPAEQSKTGEWNRQEDAFCDWVKRDGSTPYPPARDRYHLYVSLACPWAHRTIILRQLKGLEEVIGMTVVDPIRGRIDVW